MLLLKAIKCGIFGIVGWSKTSIKHGIALFTSFFDRNMLVVNDLRQRDAPVGAHLRGGRTRVLLDALRALRRGLE